MMPIASPEAAVAQCAVVIEHGLLAFSSFNLRVVVEPRHDRYT